MHVCVFAVATEIYMTCEAWKKLCSETSIPYYTDTGQIHASEVYMYMNIVGTMYFTFNSLECAHSLNVLQAVINSHHAVVSSIGTDFGTKSLMICF